jgi:hypothetical protein
MTRFYAPPQVSPGARDAVVQASLSPENSVKLFREKIYSAN